MGALDGMRIAVVDADGPIGAPAVAAFAAEGAQVAAVTVDADGDATAGVDAAAASLGGIDVLANLTKPVPAPTSSADATRDDFDAVVVRCLRTARTSNQAAFGHMQAAGGGHILNHADIAGEHGSPRQALVGAAAQGVVAWSRSAAGAFLASGVRVNVVQPGAMAHVERNVLPTLVFLAAGHAPGFGLTVPC